MNILKSLCTFLDIIIMEYRHEDQQRRQQLLTIVERGNAEQLLVCIDELGSY
jgi:hypothetical protein